MCALPEHFNQYISASPESLQVDTDHPAGMIAYVLTHQRGDSLKVQGYEQKVGCLHETFHYLTQALDNLLCLEE
jgi:hypothetical protein